MPVIIFKAVEKCNSNCAYCEVIEKHQESVMGFDLLTTVFRRIDEYLKARPDEKMTFTWHGGEVCLLGASYFRKAYEIQETCCPSTKTRIEHLIQSNMTLINQELIDAFRLLGITQIGSSYEPIPNIRGFGDTRDSYAYNRLFFKGVNLLAKNNFPWGIIYVVHRESLKRPLDVFYHLTNLNLRSGPNFNIVKMQGPRKSPLSITPLEFADFMGVIFKEWWPVRTRFPHVLPFRNYVHAAMGKARSLGCEQSGQCAYLWTYVGPDGTTSQCGRSGDHDFVSYGNIRDHKLEEIFSDNKRRPIEERNALLFQSECKDCRYWGICHGGCPMDSFAEYGDYRHKSVYCDSLRVFMEKYFEPVTGLYINYADSPSRANGEHK